MSAPARRIIARSELAARAFVITGGTMLSAEPTVADAARLVADLGQLGTVARLDRAHEALVAAYRAGQRAEGAELLVALAARYTAASQS